MLKKIVALLLLMFAFTVIFAAKDKFVLVIDAGHGGKDPGTMTKTAKEKNIALNVALAFGRYVEQNCPDVRVIYTRKTDVFIPLCERADIANRNKADAFVSIHVNSVASKKPITGMETYTMGMYRSDEKLSAAQRENEVVLIEQDYKQHYSGYDPRSPESMLIFDVINEKNMAASVELAQFIQKKTCSTARRPNKGVKQDAFLVLRETSMPACLVELGYITTPSEEKYLVNKANVDLMGRGLYQAFVEYKNSRTGKVGKQAVPAVAERKVETVYEKETVRDNQTAQQQPESAVTPDNPEPAVQSQVMATPLMASVPANDTEKTVFKVQIFTSDRKLAASDKRLKGLKDVDCYKEKSLWKYTVGSSANYNEIQQLRKTVLAKFPEAFIIAFRGNEKVDAGKAYQEYLRNKKK